MHYVVYIGNSSYFFLFFFVIGCLSENNRVIFVLLFLFFTLVCIVTTSYDKFELKCLKRLSQINVIFPIRLKFKFAVFIKWGSWINFLFMRGQDIVNNWDFPSKISRHCHKKLVPKIVVWHDQREMFVKKSLRDRLDCLVDFVGMILLRLLLPCLPTALRLPSPNCFLRVCFPTLFAAVLNDFRPLITSPISGTANANISAPLISTYASCRWDNIFTQKGNCSSPNNLCKSPKTPFSLSTNHSVVWNFYLSWSNHLVVSYMLKMNVGHLSKHQDKPSDTDRCKRYFFTRCVSQINVYNMKRVFEQRSKV